MNKTRKLILSFGLILGLGFILILTVLFTTLSVRTAGSINAEHDYAAAYPIHRKETWLNLNISFISASNALSNASVYFGTVAHLHNVENQIKAIEGHMDEMESYLEELRESLTTDPVLTAEQTEAELTIVDQVSTQLDGWKTQQADLILQAYLDENLIAAIRHINLRSYHGERLLIELNENSEAASKAAEHAQNEAVRFANNSIRSLELHAIGIILAGVLLAILITVAVSVLA